MNSPELTATESGILQGTRIAILSRCSRTLYCFRRKLIAQLEIQGAQTTGLGRNVDGFAEALAADGISFIEIPIVLRGIRPLRELKMLVRLVSTLRQLRPKILHCFTTKPVLFGPITAAISGVPIRIATITGLGYMFTSGGWVWRSMAMLLYRLSLAFTNLVFFQNRDDLEWFVSRGLCSRDKSRLVAGSGVDLEHFRSVPLPAQSGSALHFLMIARLLRDKGVLEFSRAAVMVRQRCPDCTFTLVGGADVANPTSLSDDELAAIRNEGVLRLPGAVDDVRPFLASADVFVLPSYREGMPRAALEAAAMGRPVITTNAVGCREAVRDGISGLLVPIHDHGALARAMLYFVNNVNAVAEMGRQARQFMEERFSEDRVIVATIDEYKRLIAVDRRLGTA